MHSKGLILSNIENKLTIIEDVEEEDNNMESRDRALSM